jgi:hypothetical protein
VHNEGMTKTTAPKKIYKPAGYWFTNKRGTDRKTGIACRELENEKGQRLWMDADGTISEE